jgi:hypothetical protein
LLQVIKPIVVKIWMNEDFICGTSVDNKSIFDNFFVIGNKCPSNSGNAARGVASHESGNFADLKF